MVLVVLHQGELECIPKIQELAFTYSRKMQIAWKSGR